MKNIISYIIILILLSCQKEVVQPEDHYFIANDGASMPVYIRGNIDADAIILFLHGGPGGNASQATFLPAFQEIEQSYAIAYWDQRASGLSQGNPDVATFTVEQFVEDLNYVIQSIENRYPEKDIFLFGHSWGGALGSAYLSTDNYQYNVQGFICMNSGHNLVDGLPLSVAWIKEYANEQVLNGNNVDYWNDVSAWCGSNPDMTNPDNYFTYVNYLRETDAYRHDNQDVYTGEVEASDILNSRLSLAALINGQHLGQNFNILELNLSEQMGNITIPTSIIWGKHDGVNVEEMAHDAFISIGTIETQKELILLENSAHEGYLEEPEIFVNAIINFIDTWKE